MATSDFTPTVAEVAAHLRARTKTSVAGGGSEAGTFNEHTRPTGEQVEALIPSAVRKVAARIGNTICDGNHQADLYADAKEMAAIRCAMIIELSYFPEQVGSGQSPYEQLKELWDEGMASLVEAVAEHCGGGNGLAVGGAGAKPSHSFPAARILGRETDW